MATKALRTPIRIVLYKDSSLWIAHCLEFDLCGHGSDPEAALDMLADAVTAQVDFSLDHNAPANLFSPADGKFFEMFAAGEHRATGELKIEFHSEGLEIESVDAREYRDERAVNGGHLVGV